MYSPVQGLFIMIHYYHVCYKLQTQRHFCHLAVGIVALASLSNNGRTVSLGKKRTSNYPMDMFGSVQDIVVCVWTSSRRVIISPSSPDSSWLDEVSVRCLFLRQVEDDDFVVVVHVCIFCQWCSVLASARAFCSRLASARAKVLALYMVCRISSSIAYGARSRPRPEPKF